jgi:tight adherence protein B
MTLDVDPLYLFYGFAALAAVLVAEACYLAFHNTKDYRNRVNRRLEISAKETNREKVLVQLRRERGLTSEGGFAMPLRWVNRLVVQSGAKLSVGRGLLFVIAAAGAGFAAVFVWRGEVAEALAAGGALGLLVPLAVLRHLRGRRHGKFGEQFPEAIDIIVRSLRAGYPIPVAIAMVARELPDPVGTEFGMAADEITYGADLETAMRSMMARIGQEDLPLFVTSVAIQASTGGNLSQILENLSKVIRERFKMRRKIRGLSAEGRSGALILTAAPFIIFVAINVLSPDFYGFVWDLPSTKWVLGCALTWLALGNLIMRRMINFKV